MSEKPYYQHHVLFASISATMVDPAVTIVAQQAYKSTQKRLKSLDMNGHGKVRMNKSGCLDRCEEGPVMVIYPEGCLVYLCRQIGCG